MERQEVGLVRTRECSYDIIIAGKYGVGTFIGEIKSIKKCENCYEVKFSNGLTLWVDVVWDKTGNNEVYEMLEEWRPDLIKNRGER